MMNISKLKRLVKEREADIIVGVGVLLISLVSFAAGYLMAQERFREPISIHGEYLNEEQGGEE
ncbi:MAG: hypothetical protein Q8Q38_03040 [bacterium]|nr:hypothetical protein [bacterium]